MQTALAAIGLTRPEARASLRVGFGRFTTEAEIDAAIAAINAAARAARLPAAA